MPFAFLLRGHSFLRGLAVVLGLALLPAVLSAPALAGKPEIYVSGGGIFGQDFGAGGYDVVAYHADGAAKPGSDEHVAEWKGAKWRFATAANKAAFEAEPERYAPQYGGYCAYGVSQGAAVKGDPTLWAVVDGKLYLNINPDVQKIWEGDKPGFISMADRKWPAVLE